MRILSYTQRWDKLKKPIHTTFRYPRKDKDWYEGEIVQEVYKTRSPNREVLQKAKIIKKEPKQLVDIIHEEAIADGFINLYAMFEYLQKAHKGKDIHKPINKLTIKIIGACP
jgi:hypothetical protein